MTDKQSIPLRVVQIYAENVKKLKVVDIRPDPSEPIVLLTGKNRQGKSSLLEAIWGMLLGEKYVSDDIIRDGTDRAEGLLDLGEYVVKRIITRRDASDGGKAYNTTLSVVGKGGFTAPSPQEFLSSKLGKYVQDPMAFIRLSEAEKVEMLQKLVTFAPDPEEFSRRSGFAVKAEHLKDPVATFDKAYAYLKNQRKTTNDEVRRLGGVVESFVPPEGWEVVEEVKVKDLFEERKQLEEAQKVSDGVWNDVEEFLYQTEVHCESHEKRAKEIFDIEKKIEELSWEANKLRVLQGEHEEEIAGRYQEYEHRINKALDLPNLSSSFSEIDARIETADATNKTFNAIQQWKESTEQLEAKKKESVNFTTRMDSLKAYKGELIEAAGMPVPGLGFDEGVVTYNGHPLSMASGAEQIHVGCAVCMASHPDIGLLTVDKAWAELDHDSQRVLREWAAKIGAHVIVTKVAEAPEESGWHLVEGEVVAVNGQPAPEPVKPEALEDKRGKRGGKKGKGKGVGDDAFELLPGDVAVVGKEDDVDVPPDFMSGTVPATAPKSSKSDLPPRLSRGSQGESVNVAEPAAAAEDVPADDQAGKGDGDGGDDDKPPF